MKFERKSKLIRIFTVVLTLCMITGASFLGAYPVAATSSQTSEKSPVSGKEVFTKVEQYYEADCLHLFQTAFSRLDGKEQLSWLEKLYADDDFAFFSIAVSYMAGH